MTRHAEISVIDRSILANRVLPAVREVAGGHDVLFVGVEWYTKDYERLFPDGNLVTVDIRTEVVRFGASRHTTGDVRKLNQHFGAADFRAVVCNGVIGHGLDAPADVTRALEAIAHCLATRGLLIVGWNDIDELRVPGVHEAALRAGFESHVLNGFDQSRSGPHGPMRHTFDFYVKSG